MFPSEWYFQVMFPSQLWPSYPFRYIQILHFESDISRLNISMKKQLLYEYLFEIFCFKSVLYCEITHILHLTVTLMVCGFIERFIFTHFYTTHWFSTLPLSLKIGHVLKQRAELELLDSKIIPRLWEIFEFLKIFRQ